MSNEMIFAVRSITKGLGSARSVCGVSSGSHHQRHGWRKGAAALRPGVRTTGFGYSESTESARYWGANL